MKIVPVYRYNLKFKKNWRNKNFEKPKNVLMINQEQFLYKKRQFWNNFDVNYFNKSFAKQVPLKNSQSTLNEHEEDIRFSCTVNVRLWNAQEQWVVNAANNCHFVKF